MKELLTLLCHKLQQGQSVALASVLLQQGSTPRGAGSRLLADASGLVTGTIGGGLVEGVALNACCEALNDGRARLVDFDMSGALAAKSDMICGGRLRVLVEVVRPDSSGAALWQTLLAALSMPCHEESHAKGLADSLADGQGVAHVKGDDEGQAQERESEVVLVTEVPEGAKPPRRAVRVGGVWQGELVQGALLPEADSPAPSPAHVLAQQSSLWETLAAAVPVPRENALLSVAGREYFVERCLPPLSMIIVGGGHVSRPTAQIAALAGYEVTVLDDRAEFSQAGRFPWAAHVRTVPEFENCFAHCSTGKRTSIVIITRGHVHDAAVLAQALRTGAGYVGMIGSRRKKEEVYAALRRAGVTEEALLRVYCPVGLSIGAQTPEEIAVSIVAQCIAHRYNRLWRNVLHTDITV